MSENLKIKSVKYDVVVVGGGLSGMCAAIAAARHGAKTALVHARHVLGGNASSEIRMHICGASENMMKPHLEEGGILYEMMLENKSINDYFNYSTWDMVLYSPWFRMSLARRRRSCNTYCLGLTPNCRMNSLRKYVSETSHKVCSSPTRSSAL